MAPSWRGTNQAEDPRKSGDHPLRPYGRCNVKCHEESDGEAQGQQEDVKGIGKAEELRREARLVAGVCEAASDGVHRE
eukprot:scaffold57222_cov51-Phaeocystis_antarctica.AAC.6